MTMLLLLAPQPGRLAEAKPNFHGTTALPSLGGGYSNPPRPDSSGRLL